MAPVVSRSLTSAPMASVPYSPSIVLGSGNTNRVCLKNGFLPKNNLKNGFLQSGLKWKLQEKRDSRVVVRCEASAVAEKEASESPGETREYQAEVGFLFS